MDENKTLSHTKWERKYHVVFIPNQPSMDLEAPLWRHKTG